MDNLKVLHPRIRSWPEVFVPGKPCQYCVMFVLKAEPTQLTYPQTLIGLEHFGDKDTSLFCFNLDRRNIIL
jgi:hypothetical protein